MQPVTVKPGEFVFGRKKAAAELNMKESTVWDRMKLLEKLGNIDIKSNNKFSVVNVVNWAKYQDKEPEVQQQDQQQTDNKPTTNQQQTDTNKNVKKGKNVKNDKNINIYSSIIQYLNQKAGTSFKASSKATQRLIDARLNEEFSVDDFKKVIDNKVTDANNPKDLFDAKYLRPQTLFGTKFEGYLNQKPKYQPREGNKNGWPEF